MKQALLFGGSILAILVGVQTAAIAQTDKAPAGGFGIEEIVVTAQKRSETALKVPVAMTAFSEERLAISNIVSIRDVMQNVPSISYSQANAYPRGGAAPVIRGVQVGNQAASSLYIDELPIQPLEFTRRGVPDPEMFDIQRVEVLKGPQGTLYGSASMGGTIKVITNKPDPSGFAAKVSAGYNSIDGGGDGYKFDGMANIPLADNAALRVVISHSKDGGFIKEVPGAFYLAQVTRGGTPLASRSAAVASAYRGGYVNGSEMTMARATLGLDFGQVKVTPSYLYEINDADGSSQISTVMFGLDKSAVFPKFANGGNASKVKYQMGSLPIEWNTSFGTFVSSTGYYKNPFQRDLPVARFISLSGATDAQLNSIQNPVIFDRGSERQWIQEVRFASNFTGPFNFVTGLFYRDIEYKFLQTDVQSQFIPVFGRDFYYGESGTRYKEKAAFFDAKYALTEELELGAGTRIYDYRRSMFLTSTGLLADPSFRESLNESGELYSFTGSYYPGGKENSRWQLYVRAASGFRPGYVTTSAGLNAICVAEIGATTGGNRVKRDGVWSYEAGSKWRSEDGRFDISGAAYRIDWEDIQLTRRLNCGSSVDRNGGSARINGAELQIQAVPVEQLRFDIAVGYNDAKFTQTIPGGTIFSGNPLPLVAKWTGAASVEWRPELVAEWNGYARIGYTVNGQASYSFVPPAAPFPIGDPRRELSLWNGRIGMSYDKWEASIYGTNLLNQRRPGQCIDSGFPIPGERITCINAPRTVGVSIGRSF